MSELQLVQVRKAAELTTAAEAVRARVLAGDAAMDLELLVKIEGEARRAVRALNLKTAAKRGPTFAEVVARIAAGCAPGAADQKNLPAFHASPLMISPRRSPPCPAEIVRRLAAKHC